MKDTTALYISIIKAAGYRVFMRDPQRDEYCLYTDGARIGYAQWSDISVPYVGSVHVPNVQTGSGYRVADGITPESLEAAISLHAPDWASPRDRGSVRKYPNWEAFHSSNDWNAKLVEV